MFNAGSDKFNSIVSGYPWVAHVINCFIEFGDVDFPKGKIPTCDFKTYDKLCRLLEVEANNSRDVMCACGLAWSDVMRTDVAQDAIQTAVINAVFDEDDDGDGAPPPPPAM